MAKCLVVGGAGFIGSHVVDMLVDEGHDVTVIDNLSTGLKENVNPKAEFIYHDITEPLPLIQCDYIFHLAAKARVQESIKYPVLWNETNITGTLNVLQQARYAKAKVIYSSTSSVYGDASIPTAEEHPKSPKSPYALQKLVGEMYIRLYSELYDLDYTILRYFNVYGERQILGGAYSAVIGIFAAAKSKGLPMQIRGDGKQKRDFTYVKDVARANVMAMSWPKDVFNIGNGDNRSVNQIAEYIGGKTELVDPVVEPFETLADNTRARKMGWMPTKKVEDWIHENIG